MNIQLVLFGQVMPASFTSIVLTFSFILVLLIIFNNFLKKDQIKVKKSIYIFIEDFFNFFEGLIRSVLGEKQIRTFMPIILILFTSIFIGDMVAVIGFKEVAFNSWFPFIWGFSMFCLWNGYALYKIGFKKYFKEMCEPSIFMLPLEIIGFFSKLISISVRLFGNILSGVILMTLIFKLIEILINSSVVWLEFLSVLLIPLGAGLTFYFSIFGPFIQALVFTMLTLGNIAMLVDEEK